MGLQRVEQDLATEHTGLPLGMDKVVICICIYTHTMEYYSAIKRNKLESVLVRWMN